VAQVVQCQLPWPQLQLVGCRPWNILAACCAVLCCVAAVQITCTSMPTRPSTSPSGHWCRCWQATPHAQHSKCQQGDEAVLGFS